MSMYTYGKLVDGNLVIAPKVLVTDLGTITNPTEQNYFDNGYQKVNFSDQPEFDRDNFKLEPLYIRVDNQINVSWQIIELTQEEKRQVLNNKVSLLEKQYNMCRWQREIILAENSGASDYTKTKAQEIEDLAEGLR